MRKLTHGAACSLDGYIACPDGLVDEVGVDVHPVLLGDGVPRVHRIPRSLDRERVRSEPIAHGCLYALYRVHRQAPDRRPGCPRV